MKNGILIVGGLVGLFLLAQPNQRTKDIKTISKNPAGFLSTSRLSNLEKLQDDELRQMAVISLKYEKNQTATKEESLYYQSLIIKYNL